MIWDRHLHALIPRNPLVTRELRRQQQTTSTLRGFIESVGVVLIALGFSVAMFASVASEVNPYLTLRYLDRIELLAWAFHAVVVVRMLVAGALTVSPDTYLLISDDLMVTPIRNWQLLLGKWWATLHQVRGWLLALGIMHLGIVFSTALGRFTRINWSMGCGGGQPCTVTIYGLSYPEMLTLAQLTFAVSAAIGLAILETLSCTALGLATAIIGRAKFGLISAITLRFAPTVLFAYFPDFELGPSLHGRYRFYTWFNFADFGTGAIIQMVYPIIVFSPSPDRGLMGLGVVAGMLLFFMSASLITSWLIMRRTRR
jgi:hypothetical protein